MRALLLGLVALCASAAHAKAPPCRPVPGLERLLARPETRFLIFGETHGTAETPAFFADVVCRAAQTERPLHVGVEYFVSEQADLDRFMSGADERYGQGRTFRHDGRRSAAMFEMLDRLRELKRSGLPVRIFAFVRDSEPGYNQTPHEQAIAAGWRDMAAADGRALVLVLVGNIHALKNPKVRQLPFVTAAALLPPEAVVALGVTQSGGAIWACTSEGCGPKGWPSSGGQLPRGIHLKPSDGFDGRFSVGGEFTPSPPAPGTEEP